MSSSSHQSTIVALGDINAYRKLFSKINQKFSSILLANNFSIIETSTSGVFLLNINTKYYSLESTLTVISTENIQLKDPEDLEGVFILLNNTDEIVLLQNECIKKVLVENKTCYKALISCQKCLETKKDLTKDYDDLIHVELDLNLETKQVNANTESEEKNEQDDFDELDEFVNSLFVKINY